MGSFKEFVFFVESLVDSSDVREGSNVEKPTSRSLVEIDMTKRGAVG